MFMFGGESIEVGNGVIMIVEVKEVDFFKVIFRYPNGENFLLLHGVNINGEFILLFKLMDLV